MHRGGHIECNVNDVMTIFDSRLIAPHLPHIPDRWFSG